MRSPRLRFASAVVALVASLAPAGPVAAAKEDAGKAKAELGAALGAYAKACVDAGAKAAAEAALAEAGAVGATDPAVDAAKAALDLLAEEAADAGPKADAARRAAAPAVAKAYDRLAAALAAPDAPAPAEAAAFAALRWEPSKPRIARALRVVDEAGKANRPWAAARALALLRAADPDGAAKYDRMIVEGAQKPGYMVASVDPPLVAWISLPKGWQKGKTYPVFCGAEGAGCGFRGYFDAAVGARGSRAAIVVVPCGFTNTNALDPAKYPFYAPEVLQAFDSRRMDFDGPGMDRVLELVRTRLGGDEKVFVTGFSGGGNWCYWKLFMDPDHVRGAAPACANFSGYGVTSPPAPKDGGPVVRLMTGTKDEHREHVFGQRPGIDGQTEAAMEKLKELGYTKVSRLELPVGHTALQAEVWKFVDEVLGTK